MPLDFENNVDEIDAAAIVVIVAVAILGFGFGLFGGWLIWA